MQEQGFAYHCRRLTEEIERAEHAGTMRIAAAHYKLAELHLARLVSDLPQSGRPAHRGPNR